MLGEHRPHVEAHPAVSAAAMPRNVITPLRWVSRMIGTTFSAKRAGQVVTPSGVALLDIDHRKASAFAFTSLVISMQPVIAARGARW
jgi:hypothetical protein